MDKGFYIFTLIDAYPIMMHNQANLTRIDPIDKDSYQEDVKALTAMINNIDPQ
mgnify:CR=1 FL=1